MKIAAFTLVHNREACIESVEKERDMTTYPVLKVRADKPVGAHSQVWLDDIEITSWLCSVKFDMGVDCITTATLKLIVRPDIEIPADVLASVTVLEDEDND